MKKNILYVIAALMSLLPATSFAQGKQPSQKDVDDKILTEYFSVHKIKPVRHQSGLYYVVTKSSSGETPKPGQKVSVNYSGHTMDGKTFDSNTDPAFHHVQPLEFTVGIRQVIQGWDLGLQQLKEGEKATLYIPSGLAYGPNGMGNAIAPNSILVFDVELLDIEQ